ncbi:serine/threonine-protein kinase [Kutzneria viridogrisea]|uniref:non-specific serine/threonine protein kinase n=1 Tax=Kutzneria viridogrisea TaxID=47990 RepID=A0ABR6BB05_9PSEU|nr:serine/threonine protein kinase [Kutzneria viridogrisea]
MTTPGTTRLVAGRYALLTEIGRGGMGVVWRAEDTVIGRHVALKELRLPDGVHGEERAVLEERVLREARSAGRLNDPAVVTVFDVVSDANTTYLVMELIEAPTLTELVRQNGPMHPAAAAAMGKQVLSALMCAHAAGIVHRDVKPSNVMVSASGRAKLTDFGIARIDDDPRLTSTGAVVGSPGYLAPERIQLGSATPATDLWALGATLYYAVEGRSAFERSTTATTLHAVMTEVPYLTRCQGPLASAIMGMLISSPQARLTAQQAAHLMDLAAAGPHNGQSQPNLAVPATTPITPEPSTGSRVRRVAVLAGVAVLVAAAAFGGGWLTGKLGGTATSVASPALQQTWTYGDGGQIPQFKLNTGSCASGAMATSRSYTTGTACTEPHDIEVFANPSTLDTSYKGSYPGQDAVSRDAEGSCALVFASDKISFQDRDTKLRFRALVPSADAWNRKKSEDSSEGPARESFCVLFAADGSQLTQSAIARPS